MGPFDDLLPAAAPAPGGGPFDDLLPQQGEQKGFINNSLRVGKDAGIGFISGMAGLLGKSASAAMETLPGVDEEITNKLIARRRAETGAEIPDYKAPATALRENTQAAQGIVPGLAVQSTSSYEFKYMLVACDRSRTYTGFPPPGPKYGNRK